MKIELEVCDCSGEAVLCKVTPTKAQVEKIERTLLEHPSPLFERDETLHCPVAETVVSGVKCVSFMEEDVLIMSIAGPSYMDSITIWEDKDMQERAIAETWMLFVPHLRIFL